MLADGLAPPPERIRILICDDNELVPVEYGDSSR